MRASTRHARVPGRSRPVLILAVAPLLQIGNGHRTDSQNLLDRRGKVAMPRGVYPRPPLAERFWAKVEKTDSCWVWTAATYPNGYGEFGIEGRTCLVHRVAWELLVGPIPDGLDLDHLCRNRLCVNPDHLEPVTRRENLLRGETIPAFHAAQTHCVHGHEFTPDNTHIERNGSRRCLRCARLHRWRRRLNQPQEVAA